MNRFIVTAIAASCTICFTQFAVAADLPSKAPPMAPAPIAPSWTGFYAGLNLGYGWTDDRSITVSANDPSTQAFLNNVIANVSPSPKSHGILGGLQLGYNYQFAPSWLVGIETDFQASSLNDTASGSFLIVGVPVPFSTAAHQDINWFGTVRGRLGYLVTPSWLVYGTGGFAYGRVEQSYSTADLGVAVGVLTPPSFTCTGGGAVCAAGSKTDTRGGWTAGGGFEYLLPNFRILNHATTVKLEYLYVNLGSQDVVVPTASNPAASFTAHSGDVVFNVVRAGVNVKF